MIGVWDTAIPRLAILAARDDLKKRTFTYAKPREAPTGRGTDGLERENLVAAWKHAENSSRIL